MGRIPGRTIFVRVRCPREICEARNAQRPENERVPAEYMARYFAELENMPGRAGLADCALEVSQAEARDPGAILDEVFRRASAEAKNGRVSPDS